MGIRVSVDDSDEKIGKKVRNAFLEKSFYLATVGEKEMKEGKIAIRGRGEKETVSMNFEEFIEKLKVEIDNKK